MTTINLLPWRATARLQTKKQLLKDLSGYSIVVLLLLTLWHCAIQHKIDFHTKNNLQLSHELLSLNEHNKNLLNLEQQATNLQALNKQITRFTQMNNSNIELLLALSNNTPKNLQLSFLNKMDNQVTLKGNATTLSVITAFIEKLSHLSKIQHVNLQEIKNANDNMKQFVISLQWKYST